MSLESRQPRIETQATLSFRDRAGGDSRKASLKNLSWGGALLGCDARPGQPGDRVELRLPYHSGIDIPVQAEILRVERTSAGRFDVAIRFERLSLADEGRLENMLRSLLSLAGGPQDARARLTQPLDIYTDDPAEVRVTLEDIARGELVTVVPCRFRNGQSLLLTIAAGRYGEFRLRARVARQIPITTGSRELYRVYMSFEHPLEDLNLILGRVIGMEGSRARV